VVFKFAFEIMRRFGIKSFIERPSRMGIEIILHQSDAGDIGLMLFNKCFHESGIIAFRAARTHLDDATSS
jgi:hypothetical protein